MNSPTRKNISKFLIVLTLATVLTGSATAFADGDGSSGDPYQISQCSHFESISSNNHHVITQDIDCSGYDFTPATDVDGAVLNGNDYTITGFDYTRPSAGDDAGLFIAGSSSYDNTVANLTMENFYVKGYAASALVGGVGSVDIDNVVVKDGTVEAGYRGGALAAEGGTVTGAEIINVDVIEGSGVGYSVSGEDVTLKNVYVEGEYVALLSGSGGGFTDVTIKDSRAHGTGSGAININYRGLTTFTFENVTMSGSASYAAITDNGNSLTNGRIVDFSMPISAGDKGLLFEFETSDSSADQIVVADVSGVSRLFGSSSGDIGSNANAVYYDSETTSITADSGDATALTTSQMQGDSASDNMPGLDFVNVWQEVINPDDYPILQANVVPPPTVDAINSPANNTSYFQNAENVTFSADVSTSSEESATVNFIVEDPSGSNSTIESFNQNAGTTETHIHSQTFSETGNYEWWVNVETASKSVTESATSFNIVEYQEPQIDLWLPENDSVYELDWNEQGHYEVEYQFNITIDDAVTNAEYTLNTIEGTNCGIDGSQAVGDDRTGEISSSGTFNHFCGIDGGDSDTWSIEVNDSYTNVESGEFSFDTEVVNIPPQIQNFEVTPSISDIEVGESFDLSVEGDTGTFNIDSITYSLDVTGNTNPQDIVVNNPDFANENSFNDAVQDAFEYKSSYQGETLTLEITVTDENGYTDTVSTSATTAVQPDQFILNNPANGENFLTPEGSNNIDVTFDYGVDTSKHGGTVELVQDGSVIDSFSVSSNTQRTETYTKSFSDGDYSWKVRFTDSVTSNTYESSTRTFQVSDTPFAITLQDPKGGETFNLIDQSSKDVDHNFEVDARATNKDYYYGFVLRNDSSNAIIEERNSSDLNTGIESFTETVQGLGAGDYEWTVNVYFSSDDSLQESKSTTYSIVENPKFEASLNNPFDGEQIEIGSSESITDVNSSYSIETFKESVDVELFLDGSLVDNRSLADQSDHSVDVALQDVSTGQHTVKLEVEDESGRTYSQTNSFRIIQEDQANITLTELKTTPSLDQMKPSDESFNIYFEADNRTAVEYVEFEILVNGTVKETIKVPASELETGSIFTTQLITLSSLELTYEELTNSEVSIRATVVDVGQNLYRWTRSYVFGINDPTVSLNRPYDYRTFPEVSGSPEQHALSFDISTTTEYVDYTVQVNNTILTSGTVTQTGSTVTKKVYVNVVNDLGFSQFGQFKWKVNITEQITDYSTESPIRYFNIKSENETGVLLNFNLPSKNDFYTITGSHDTTRVPFNFDWKSNETGRLTLKIKGETNATFYDQEVGTGVDSEELIRQLPVGSYKATLKFVGDQGTTKTEVRKFSVEKEKNVPKNEVFILDPRNGESMYQGARHIFKHGVNASDTGETWFTIYDSSGSAVKNYTYEYETQNKVSSYWQEENSLDLDVGEYTAQAYLETDSGDSYSSDNVSFTVEGFNIPRVEKFDSPENNTVFTEGEPISFRFQSQTFEDSATVRLKVRYSDEYDAVFTETVEQDANSQRSINITTSELEPGQYAWTVLYDVNPTFSSDQTYYFTVEEEQVQQPNFNLVSPEQNETFNIVNGTETGISFDYSAEVFTTGEIPVKLMISSRENGLKNFKQYASSLQNGADGIVDYNETVNLSEGAYFYKIRAEYPSATYESDPVGFAVGENQTAPQPEEIEPKESNIVGDILKAVSGFVGVALSGLASGVVMVIGIILTIYASAYAADLGDSDLLGIFVAGLCIIAGVDLGVYPTWVGIIMFAISGGIFIFAVRKTHGGE